MLGGFNAGLQPIFVRRRSRCGGKEMQRLLNVHSSLVVEKEMGEEETAELGGLVVEVTEPKMSKSKKKRENIVCRMA